MNHRKLRIKSKNKFVFRDMNGTKCYEAQYHVQVKVFGIWVSIAEFLGINLAKEWLSNFDKLKWINDN